MIGRNRFPAALYLVLLAFVLGCGAFPEQQLSEDFPPSLIARLELQPKVRLGVGSAVLVPARLVSLFWPSTASIRAATRGVRKVEVGVFEIQGGLSGSGGSLWHRMSARLLEKGWQLLTRVQDPEEVSWVFYLPGRHGIRQMYVISLNRNTRELVLVKIYGRLDRTIQAVLNRELGNSR